MMAAGQFHYRHIIVLMLSLCGAGKKRGREEGRKEGIRGRPLGSGKNKCFLWRSGRKRFLGKEEGGKEKEPFVDQRLYENNNKSRP